MDSGDRIQPCLQIRESSRRKERDPDPAPNPTCLPGHPGISVDVKRGDGASEAGGCFKEPHLHVRTGIPLGLSTGFEVIEAQPRQNAHSFLAEGQRS